MFHMMFMSLRTWCGVKPDVKWIRCGSDVDQINITWNQPSIPNGIIIMYDIRYRESNNSDSFTFFVNGISYNRHTIYHIRINKFHKLNHWCESIHYCWSRKMDRDTSLNSVTRYIQCI